MSTVRVATLANQAGTGSPDVVGGELSRARFNLNGTGTIAARDTFNVSSFVDNGTGDYTANFAVAMPNADYSAAGIVRFDATAGLSNVYLNQSRGGVQSASAFQVQGQNNSAAAADCDRVLVMFVGDKP